MGEVIRFPQERVDHFKSTDYARSAIVVVLPVIAIPYRGAEGGRYDRLMSAIERRHHELTVPTVWIDPL